MIRYKQAKELKELGVDQTVRMGDKFYVLWKDGDVSSYIHGTDGNDFYKELWNVQEQYKAHSTDQLKAAIHDEGWNCIRCDSTPSRVYVECWKNNAHRCFSNTGEHLDVVGADTEEEALADILIQIYRAKKPKVNDMELDNRLTQEQCDKLQSLGVWECDLEELLQAIEDEGYLVGIRHSGFNHECELSKDGLTYVELNHYFEYFNDHKSRIRNVADALIWVLEAKKPRTCGECKRLQGRDIHSDKIICSTHPDLKKDNQTFVFAVVSGPKSLREWRLR